MTNQIIQIFGAVVVLIAYILGQTGRMSIHSKPYLWLNLCGSLILGTLAAMERQWGFLLLEVVWGGTTLWGILRPPKEIAQG